MFESQFNDQLHCFKSLWRKSVLSEAVPAFFAQQRPSRQHLAHQHTVRRVARVIGVDSALVYGQIYRRGKLRSRSFGHLPVRHAYTRCTLSHSPHRSEFAGRYGSISTS